MELSADDPISMQRVRFCGRGQCGCESKLNHQELDRRLQSMFSFTRATHFGVTLNIDPQPC